MNSAIAATPYNWIDANLRLCLNGFDTGCTMTAWQNFFFLTGSAAATLSGLMFIAITFGAKLITKDSFEKANTFYSPIWFHFVQVFLLSAVASMPMTSPAILACVAIVSALWCLSNVPSALRVIRDASREHRDIESSDWWLGLILPAACYAVMALTGLLFFFKPETAINVLAITLLAILIIAMRQAWDMLLWTATKI